jgi:hypothetical protein
MGDVVKIENDISPIPKPNSVAVGLDNTGYVKEINETSFTDVERF